MAQVVLEPVSRPSEPSPPPLRARRKPSRAAVVRVVKELVLLAVLFGVYNLGRYISAQHAGTAFEHAGEVIRLQASVGLPSEAEVQGLALRSPALIELANRYYAGVHFPLTAIVLVWLMVRRPARYAGARWALASLTGLALIGHALFPLAPPRMMPGWIDTGIVFGQSVYGPSSDSGVANQFAAMPSLHVGWAFMVAVFLIRYTRFRWRGLWVLHPLVTFAVVVTTANHYWLDGLVAIALALPLLLVFGSRPSWSRRGARLDHSRPVPASAGRRDLERT